LFSAEFAPQADKAASCRKLPVEFMPAIYDRAGVLPKAVAQKRIGLACSLLAFHWHYAGYAYLYKSR
jgi:hypothetical protein